MQVVYTPAALAHGAQRVLHFAHEQTLRGRNVHVAALHGFVGLDLRPGTELHVRQRRCVHRMEVHNAGRAPDARGVQRFADHLLEAHAAAVDLRAHDRARDLDGEFDGRLGDLRRSVLASRSELLAGEVQRTRGAIAILRAPERDAGVHRRLKAPIQSGVQVAVDYANASRRGVQLDRQALPQAFR